MIVRSWRAITAPDNAESFQETFSQSVLPDLERKEGYRGAYLLRLDRDDETEFVVLSLWDSLDAIHRFAGTAVLTAVVSPAMAAIMSSFDTTVTHHTIVTDTVRGRTMPG
jgi:heme-degrading monooxygenase HmoA